jgi:hypothetical protein
VDAQGEEPVNYLSNVWDWLADAAHWHGPEGVPQRLLEHLQICAVSLLFALLIAVPIGLVLGHYRRGGFLVINIANLGRAVPALAILLIAVLTFGIKSPPRYLTTIGIVSFPAFIALVAWPLWRMPRGVGGPSRPMPPIARRPKRRWGGRRVPWGCPSTCGPRRGSAPTWPRPPGCGSLRAGCGRC